MDNVFDKFDTDIKCVENDAFLHYLRDEVFNPVSLELLAEIMEKTGVYIFSGVTRDYFLGCRSSVRDIDVVVERDIDWLEIYRKYHRRISVKINSYGGFKVNIGNLSVDVWTMQRTWGLMHKGIAVTPRNLIRTAFFNFSAILYSLNRRRFYIHRSFADFLRNRKIGLLYKENPNVPLCIVNSIYYSERLQMPVTPELARWIVSHYSIFDNYNAPQLAHWGVVRYSSRDIHLFVSRCQLL